MAPEIAENTAQTPVEKPLRRDAERNRQLILEAGRQLFAERGLSVTLDDIAERAGVGVGTVYRRFPDRDALVDALFKEKISQVVARAEAAEALDDPWEGLVAFMRGHMLAQQADRAYASVVLTDTHGHEALRRGKAQIAPIVERIVQRAKDAGVVRGDLAFTDIPMLMLMCGSSLDATRDLCPHVWERYFSIVLDGIRPGATSTLSAPLPEDQVPEAMRCGLN
ncbi:MAG: helix-turn-helix domain-containing protein, partial [Solirubrobacteraceae bacterium]|nr:helix-turn-helix domain-containing protein [Solirubrobacteraceae bacterium]